MSNYKVAPQSTVDIDNQAHQKAPRWRSWRVTVLGGALLGGVVLLINVGLLVWTRSKFEIINGIATVFEGDCATSQKISTYGHLAINILSTLLLSASNNCAQLLCAPTRKDVSAAHEKGKWLDIGVMSLRNLGHISGWRGTIWAVLMLSSLPLHLLYNSVIFTTLAGHDYFATLVTEDFVTGSWWNETRADLLTSQNFYPPFYSGGFNLSQLNTMQQQAKSGQLKRLENEECLKNYFYSSLESNYGNLLVVTSANLNDTAIDWYLHTGEHQLSFLPWVCNSNYTFDGINCLSEKEVLGNAAAWTAVQVAQCQADSFENESYCRTRCFAEVRPCPVVTASVEYCLAAPYTQRCTARLETTLLTVVTVCNAVKIIAMLLCAFWRFEPLATVGDAVASFLNDPERRLNVQGPLSVFDIRKTSRPVIEPTGEIIYRKRSLRWRSAANLGRWFSRWLVCLYTSSALLILAIALLIVAVTSEGFPGHFTTGANAYLIRITTSASLTLNIILPNVAQLLLSFVYAFYNNALTYMLLAHEWSQFATHRETLRVTSPIGQQRSTLRLQIPYLYALPLMTAMAVLHWLISQSIFLVQVSVYDLSHSLDYTRLTNACGYSSLALALAIALGGILVLALIGISFRKLDEGIPMAGSCSEAISAACGNSEDGDAALRPLMYGVLTNKVCEGSGRQYVGFSPHEVLPLEDGVAYL